MAVALPLAWGVNVKVNDAVPPDPTDSGRDGPLRVNSVLLTAAEVTVTVPPVALRVAVRLLLAPTVTLPKVKLLGVTVNWPDATPVPERAIGRVGSDAFEIKTMVPFAAPAC